MSDTPTSSGRLCGPDLLAQQVADNAYRRAAYIHASAIGDSPIERLFAAALKCAIDLGQFPFVRSVLMIHRGRTLDDMRALAEHMGQSTVTLYLEAQVGDPGWRADFFIHWPVVSGGEVVRLDRMVVECDGHEFHERTKGQAARDRSRDRVAQSQGLPIFRFTGSEIWNDPMACAHEVIAFIESRP